MSVDARASLACYCEDWARLTKHGNATALRELAREIRRLPPDDERLQSLAALQEKQHLDVVMFLNPQSHELVEQYDGRETAGALLDRLVELEVSETIDEGIGGR